MNRDKLRKITRSGDSYYIRIPLHIVESLGLKEEDYVIIESINDGFIVKKWNGEL